MCYFVQKIDFNTILTRLGGEVYRWWWWGGSQFYWRQLFVNLGPPHSEENDSPLNINFIQFREKLNFKIVFHLMNAIQSFKRINTSVFQFHKTGIQSSCRVNQFHKMSTKLTDWDLVFKSKDDRFRWLLLQYQIRFHSFKFIYNMCNLLL